MVSLNQVRIAILETTTAIHVVILGHASSHLDQSVTLPIHPAARLPVSSRHLTLSAAQPSTLNAIIPRDVRVTAQVVPPTLSKKMDAAVEHRAPVFHALPGRVLVAISNVGSTVLHSA